MQIGNQIVSEMCILGTVIHLLSRVQCDTVQCNMICFFFFFVPWFLVPLSYVHPYSS